MGDRVRADERTGDSACARGAPAFDRGHRAAACPGPVMDLRTRREATPPRHHGGAAEGPVGPASRCGRDLLGVLMRITFFGTRGSQATPGHDTVRYGGNTSCVGVQAAD